MVKGAGKMRARPRIEIRRQPVNPNPNMSSPETKRDAKRDMDQDIDAYQNIAQAVCHESSSVLRAACSLIVRGSSTGQGQNMNVSPQSGLGGMNRPNQPTRQASAERGSKDEKEPHDEPRRRGPFLNVASPTKQDAVNGFKKLYRPNN